MYCVVRLSGTQRIAVKFRNFVSFYDLSLSRTMSDIQLNHVRTLRITSVDGRETRLDDNPSQELRRQFGELQKRVRALNNYTSGIQKKLDKGLRPGTVTQGVLSMTRLESILYSSTSFVFLPLPLPWCHYLLPLAVYK